MLHTMHVTMNKLSAVHIKTRDMIRATVYDGEHDDTIYVTFYLFGQRRKHDISWNSEVIVSPEWTDMWKKRREIISKMKTYCTPLCRHTNINNLSKTVTHGHREAHKHKHRNNSHNWTVSYSLLCNWKWIDDLWCMFVRYCAIFLWPHRIIIGSKRIEE